MQSLSVLTTNLLDIGWSIGVCLLYVVSTVLLGARCAPRLEPGWTGAALAVQFALGSAVLGLVFTLLAWSGLAFTPALLVIAAAPLALEWRRVLSWFREKRHRGPLRRGGRSLLWARRFAVFGIVLLALHPFFLAVAHVRGGDVAIYHLVIPRTIVWNHGLVFNPFSHDAGIYYGWQLYSLPAYILAGDRGFQLCSFFAFALLVLTTYRVLRDRAGDLTGVLGALIAAAVLCGMSRDSMVNNDIPLILLELALVAIALAGEPGRRTPWMLGLLGGFLVAVKLVAVATLPIAYAGWLWRRRSSLPSQAAVLAVATLLSVAPWPLFDYLSSGSPLPHFLLAWPPESGYLPQYRESIGYMMENFGLWYRANIGRFFLRGMEFVPILLAGVAMIPFSRSARTDRLCLVLIAYAVLRTLFLLALNGFDNVVLFHDRYHLGSYLALCLAGLLGWAHVLEAWDRERAARWAALLPLAVLAAACSVLYSSGWQVDMGETGVPADAVRTPSLWQLVGYHKRLALYEQAGGGRTGTDFDLTAEILPARAVVATTVIDPYLLRRPFLQMLPVSENLIDLSLPAERIRTELLRRGATHLHLTQYSGLNGWMTPVVDRWLETLRQVPRLPGVRRLYEFDYPASHGRMGVYALDSEGTGAVAPIQRLWDIRLTSEPDGSWTVRWHAEPGAEVRVLWRQVPGLTVTMGHAVSEIGRFPLSLGMPDGFGLSVEVLSGGTTVQTVELTAVRPRKP